MTVSLRSLYKNTAGTGISWTKVTTTSQDMVPFSGYITNNISRVSLLLPASAGAGSVIYVVGEGIGGWRVTQRAGQQIVLGDSASTLGVGGYVESAAPTVRYASIFLVCIVANSTFAIAGSEGVLELI